MKSSVIILSCFVQLSGTCHKFARVSISQTCLLYEIFHKLLARGCSMSKKSFHNFRWLPSKSAVSLSFKQEKENPPRFPANLRVKLNPDHEFRPENVENWIFWEGVRDRLHMADKFPGRVIFDSGVPTCVKLRFES